MKRFHATPFSLKSMAALVAIGSTLLPLAVRAEVDCTNIIPIYSIQGAGHYSPFAGEIVETCGVVTAVGFDRYFMQDPFGDADQATSDGLEVYVGSGGDKPPVGTLLRLRDRVDEYVPGGSDTGNLSITQFAFPEVLASEADTPLPQPTVIGRSGRVPPAEAVISETELPVNLQDPADAAANPFNPGEDGIDFYESLEGMLVIVEDPVAISAIRQFGTFSAEVFVLANNGADALPADARTERGGINLQPDADNRGDQNPERVQIQFDGTLFGSTDYPPIKVGDRLADIVGVVGYSFGNFEVNTLAAVELEASAIAPEVSRPFVRGPWKMTLASYNVLNLSAVASDDAQRTLIAAQIVNHLRSPDVIALQEIQDNNGDIGDCPADDPSGCSGVLAADQTLQALVDAVIDAGGPVYQFATVDPLVETTDDNRDDPDTFGGVSLGNIRNAFLYNPRRVTLESVLGITRDALAARGVADTTAFDGSRDPLLGIFNFRGERLVVINNHFTSRFGSSPIFGGPQPFVQAGETDREAQARAINALTDSLLAEGYENLVVVGDLNTFEFTDDLAELLPGVGGEQVLENLISKNRDDNRYSFIFEGNSQVLDHIFATEALAARAQLDILHINVDFPRRAGDLVASDHEPLLAIFPLGPR